MRLVRRTLQDHHAIACGINSVRESLSSILIEVSARCGKSHPSTKALYSALNKVGAARSALDDQLFEDVGPSEFSTNIYYGGPDV